MPSRLSPLVVAAVSAAAAAAAAADDGGGGGGGGDDDDDDNDNDDNYDDDDDAFFPGLEGRLAHLQDDASGASGERGTERGLDDSHAVIDLSGLLYSDRAKTLTDDCSALYWTQELGLTCLESGRRAASNEP